MLKDLKNAKEGIVMVTVLMIVMIMMVLSVSILNLNVSQVSLMEGEVRRIQSEILTEGCHAYVLANRISGSNAVSIPCPPVTLGNTTFSFNSDLSGAGLAGTETNSFIINTTY